MSNTAIKVARLEPGAGRWELKADPDALPADAWDWSSGQPAGAADSAACWRAVPVLNRGLTLVCNAVAALPFEIRRGDEIIDTSAQYRNVVGFLPAPQRLFWLLEAASYTFGSAYLWRERRGRLLAGLRYLLPSTVTPKLDSQRGLVGFQRSLGASSIPATPDDIIYLWRPDPFVELGPATTSPVMAAVAAAGVLLRVDEFAAQFFARGAIKATLLTVEGAMPPDAERKRLKAWWERVVQGLRNAFAAEVINAAIKPVIIGDGIAELANVPLTDDKRKDVAAALGIPMSILFSDTARGLGGGGVAMQDDVNFYGKTVVPESDLLAEVLNTQLFAPLGYRLNFLPETLDVFQEDEAQRAQALGVLVTALADPLAEVAMSILGYELRPEQAERLRELWAEKAARAEQMAERLRPPAPEQPESEQPEPEQPESEHEPDEAAEPPAKALLDWTTDLDKWQRKCLKAGRARPFDSTAIPPAVREFVETELAIADGVAAIKAVFTAAGVMTGPEPVLPETAGHTPERIPVACPLCGSAVVDRYADHGGLCVCPACGATFDPEVYRG